MADDNIKGVKNVVKGPWKRAKSVKSSQDRKTFEDMMFC